MHKYVNNRIKYSKLRDKSKFAVVKKIDCHVRLVYIYTDKGIAGCMMTTDH